MPISKGVPDECNEVICWCALRFDGGKYDEELKSSDSVETYQKLSDLTQPMLTTLTFYEREEMNFAAFFWLQRSFHFLDDDFSKDSRGHVLFDLLYLHLYKTEVPERYRNEENCSRWQRECENRAEKVAALVRKSFRRSIRTEKNWQE